MEVTEGLREVWLECEECEGVGGALNWFSLSESSSSPMAKAPPSSGTLLKAGERALCGLRKLSTEPLREPRVGLVGFEAAIASSFLRCCCRSISSRPLSRVNDRKASKRLLDLKMLCMNVGLSIESNQP